jgi:rhodanese-related sulfurtransferase
MKTISKIIALCMLLTGIGMFKAHAQLSPKPATTLGLKDPWTADQLLEPSVLADKIKTGEAKNTLILNIGAVEDIKGATHIGAVNDAANLEKLKTAVATLPKNTELVIYCGCCPFVKCPNIRPAFLELKKAGFTNVKLLNLATNLKTNWIAKGYPLAGE